MSAILQIVDGFAGSLVCELNAWAGGFGSLTMRGLNLTEGQLATLNDGSPSWSPLSGAPGNGRRRITVPFVLIGTSADDVGLKVAKLSQATAAPWWLRVRRSEASADSWLQCFPTVPQVNSQVTASDNANMAVGTITAETAPYALGDRVDGSNTLSMDPSSSAFGMNIDNVLGDTPTPLLIRINDSTAFSNAMGAFISVRRRQTPGNLFATTLTRQAEHGSNTLVSGTNVTVSIPAGTDAAMSGGSFVRATFGSSYVPLTAGQVTFSGPSLSGLDVPGVYRMFVRIRRSGEALTTQTVLKAWVNGSLITPDEITVPANGAAIRLVDLGLIQWPSGQPAGLQAPLSNPSGATTTSVLLQFWRKSGVSSTCRLDLDYLCWIPADEDSGYLTTDMALPTPSTQWVVVDGYQQLATVTSANPNGTHNIIGQEYSSTVPTPTWTGRVPRVRPGTNRLFVVAGVGAVDDWPIAQTFHVQYSYWPRYTWLR